MTLLQRWRARATASPARPEGAELDAASTTTTAAAPEQGLQGAHLPQPVGHVDDEGVTTLDEERLTPGPSPAEGGSSVAARIRTVPLRRALTRLGVFRYLTDVLALGGAVLAVGELGGPAPPIMAVVALVMLARRGLKTLRRAGRNAVSPTGSSVLARLFVLLGLAAYFPPDGHGWVGALVVALVVLTEMPLAPIARVAVPFVQNLPGIRVRNQPILAAKWVYVSNTAGLAVLGVALAAGVSGTVVLALAVVLLAPTLLVLGDATERIVARHRAEPLLPEMLAEYGPTFLFYWMAPTGSKHQVTMWLPYLERLGQPFIILLRNPATFAEISSETTRPIVVRRFAAEVDPLVVPTLKTVFYVNTAPKNEHMLRFLHLNQIQLNHGDSDKAPSYRRAFRLYDKNFVAGQAAIDRFASHGVKVPRDAFEIVGRPQVESITVADRLPSGTARRVLYAPTWFGYLNDSRYSSLPVGLEIVSALLRRGCTVVFRPHPWYRRSGELTRQVGRVNELLRQDAATSGRRHVFGEAAEREHTLVDCFNAVDCMISDVSSVVADFLYSEKPFAVVDTQPELSADEFAAEFPLARAAYVLSAELVDLERVLDDLLVVDPLAGVRRSLKSYYLGDFPPERYADGFLDAARPYV